MTLLARLIAHYEGYDIHGSLPNRNHNPGDLRHSPHSQHGSDPNGIGQIDTPEEGWADLERQLELYAQRNMTVRAAIYAFAPPSENDTEKYLNYVCKELGLPDDAPVSEALKVA